IPHNHPIPVLKKASFELKETYRRCIRGAGTVGATVAKVDNAPSTQVLLGGKTPGEVGAALQDQRVKQKLVHEVKMDEYPAGLDAAGQWRVFHFKSSFTFVIFFSGGMVILTCLAALMKLLDDTGVTSFETDTTFKRVAGEMNEWEVVLFLKSLQRGDTEFFERLYDEFQAVKLQITGKPVAFKRFVEGGNLIALNSDMEAAQVLGAAKSFLKSNNPEYSGISNDTPPQRVAPEFVKLCTTHGKRGVLALKPYVSEEDHRRLMDFVYIDSAEKLAEFDQFVRSLGVKEDWDNTPSTTNTGEAQHHWTNLQTGVKQSLVEAIEKYVHARKLEERVAREIEISIRSGVLVNSRNESYDRRARNTARQSATIRKAHESHQISDEVAEIDHEIEEIRVDKRESAARLKALQARKSEIRKKPKTATSAKRRTIFVSSNSSGRVKT
ncbi:hypothetical protein B0H13DRAFT_1520259, partial [Mycena leptocephala]